MNFHLRLQQTKFQQWLNTPIFNGIGLETDIRKYVIRLFIKDLREFLSLRGYAFRNSENDMILNWARFLFRLQYSMRLPRFLPAEQSTPEDFHMYEFTFSNDAMNSFLQNWNHSQDLDPESPFGLDAQNYLFLFTWQYIDINSSSITTKVDEMMNNGFDSDDDLQRPRTGLDPYLADQSNSSSKYGRWD